MSLICETIVSEDELSQTRDSETSEGVVATQELDEELDYEEEREEGEEERADDKSRDKTTDIRQSVDTAKEKEKEKEKREDSDKDEGELEDDDDLEEGEVKEEDEDEEEDIGDGNDSGGKGRKRVMAPDGQTSGGGDGQQQTSGRQQSSGQTQSICRFYGRGQCTWGNNCRFLHPTGGMIKRMPQMPPPMAAMPPMPPHLAHVTPQQHQHSRQNRPNREFYDNHSGGGGPPLPAQQPPLPVQQSSGGSESAWERGLKQAKEMIVRASRRKEEEIDFEDKRFNLGVEDIDTSRHSRDQSRSPDNRYPSVDNDEYERRRRLAFESAPWNNDEPTGAKVRGAESYRDPWRRSKSPPQQMGGAMGGHKFRRGPPLAPSGSRSGSKRSHSMSSISASGSDSSDFSGSEDASEDSFSDSSNSGEESKRREEKGFGRDNQKITNRSNRGEENQQKRYRGERGGIERTDKKREVVIGGSGDHVINSAISSSSGGGGERGVGGKQSNKGPLGSNWGKGVTSGQQMSEREGGVAVTSRDDNREYDSWSESLSDSESISSYYSGSESLSGNDSEIRNQKKNKKSSSMAGGGRGSGSGAVVDTVGERGPPNKKARTGLGGAQSQSPPSHRKEAESAKKPPIKMTFMKKQPNLKKDSSVAVKLNGGRGGGTNVEEDDAEELLAEAEEDSLEMSPKPISSASPVSGEGPPDTPPPEPEPHHSSSPSPGSSKYEKSLMRRKELLEQLKAVEDAIARKRSKIN